MTHEWLRKRSFVKISDRKNVHRQEIERLKRKVFRTRVLTCMYLLLGKIRFFSISCPANDVTERAHK